MFGRISYNIENMESLVEKKMFQQIPVQQKLATPIDWLKSKNNQLKLKLVSQFNWTSVEMQQMCLYITKQL